MKLPLKIQLSILFFGQYFVWGTWFVTLGTYLLQTLQFNGTEVGLVYGAMAIAASISPFFIGIIADQYLAVEKLLSGSYIIGGIVLGFNSMMQEFTWFYLLLLIYTILFVPAFSLSNAIAFHHLKNSQRDFPRVRVWGTIAWIVAGLIIGFLNIEDTVIPLRIAAASSILLGLYCLLLPNTPPKAKKKKFSFKDALGLNTLALLKERSFAVLMIGLLLIRIPGSFYYTFVNPFLNEIGIANAAGKMTLGQVSEVLLMLILPFCFRKIGLKKMIFIGMLLWGLRYLFFMLGQDAGLSWLLYLGIIVHGITFNFTSLSGQIYIDSQVDPSQRNAAQGFITFITMGVGQFIGSFFAGSIVHYYALPNGTHNWWAIWMYPTLIGLSIAFVFLFLFQPKKNKLQE